MALWYYIIAQVIYEAGVPLCFFRDQPSLRLRLAGKPAVAAPASWSCDSSEGWTAAKAGSNVVSQTMLEESWQKVLGSEFEKPYMQQLRVFLRHEKDQKKIIYPPSAEVFQAFTLTPLPAVKVVLLGQDPYHGPGQAQGLCFSVPPGKALPPSLVNIYKELQADLGIPLARNGCLIPWAKQGVLLLNSVLTVEKGKAASHQGKGWEQFTDKAIEILNEYTSSLVFLLWGSYAQRKGAMIDVKRHCVLKAAHPSPFSAHQGFLGCRHFSKTNHYLEQQGKAPIDWKIQEVTREKLV